jgi:hypothetical protein
MLFKHAVNNLAGGEEVKRGRDILDFEKSLFYTPYTVQ